MSARGPQSPCRRSTLDVVTTDLPPSTEHGDRSQPTWMIQSIVRLAAILDLFTAERPIWTEQEIVGATGLSRGTVYRFCQTLLHVGYLDAAADGGYRPGPRAMTLGQAAILGMDIAELARPTLIALQAELQETVNMAVPDGHDIVYVIRLRGSGLLDIRLQVGSRLPAFCTSLGRAMLAQLPDEELTGFLDTADLSPRTEATVTDPKVLRTLIRDIRAKGYAVNDGELAHGLRGVAAAVRYPTGRPAAAINVALTRPFRPGEPEQELGPLLRSTAERIERLLIGEDRTS
ncbi:IclR family transcriptional regulator [Saccharopolyspora hattusasensis]|uniref:IclR family transcriptional regulator n=1 Tax=Saccharopolyspora hattusasensis TaxID=1128679 RepID=UPI003D96C502